MIHRAAIVAFMLAVMLQAQQSKVVWSAQEKPIVDGLGGLRGLADEVRATTTKQLAARIRALPPTPNKLRLATGLAGLSTEGDFGTGTLQVVAATLADALREQPAPNENGQPAGPYVELASLIRYEHIPVELDSPQLKAATAKLIADDADRLHANFTLTDLSGKEWTLQNLRGKVVLVNFWATWCPPCRKEMPDLEGLYNQFKGQGLVILAISDEEMDKVKPFLATREINYPILLDPGRKVNTIFHVEGIPKSFVYDRSGKLAAQSIDMRTRGQFLTLLGEAGLH